MDSGVERFYLPAIDSESHDRMLELESAYPQNCFAMMGLHPCSVNETYKQELNIVEDWLSKRRFAAVGEIGLDFYWDKTFTSQQYEAFHFQIELALQYKLPIVIHTRNAMQETIDVVKQYTERGLSGIFHCFGGTSDDALQITEMGFLLGIGGVVTYKNSGLPEVLAAVSLDNIVLETDAPYLAPAPFRGKRNESAYLKYIIEKLSDVYQQSNVEIARQTSENAIKLYS